MFFAIHEALFASIDVERRGGLLQTGQLATVTRIDRCEPAAFRRLFAPSSDLSVAREGRRDGRELGKIGSLGFVLLGIKKVKTALPASGPVSGRTFDSQFVLGRDNQAAMPLRDDLVCKEGGNALHQGIPTGAGEANEQQSRVCSGRVNPHVRKIEVLGY